MCFKATLVNAFACPHPGVPNVHVGPSVSLSQEHVDTGARLRVKCLAI